ncbi:MAG: hypothetical protein U0794_04630 [Isosphaeraceae bacterium]
MTIDSARSRRLILRDLLGLSVAAVSLGLLGCGDELPAGFSRKVLKLEEVPTEITKVAEKSLPGVKFQDAWSNLDKEGKLHSYEIRGRAANGKIREVRLSPSGEVLEME